MRATLAALLILNLAAAEASEPDHRLDAVLNALAQPAPTVTPFVERRESALLTVPLTVLGRLEQPDADTLVRVVEAPHAERSTVRDGRVELVREGEPTRRFSLRRAPELAALLDSFRALLSGQRNLLTEHYTVAFEGIALGLLVDERLSRDGDSGLVVQRADGHRSQALVLALGRHSIEETRAALLAEGALCPGRGLDGAEGLLLLVFERLGGRANPRPAPPAAAHVAVARTALARHPFRREDDATTQASACSVHGSFLPPRAAWDNRRNAQMRRTRPTLAENGASEGSSAAPTTARCNRAALIGEDQHA